MCCDQLIGINIYPQQQPCLGNIPCREVGEQVELEDGNVHGQGARDLRLRRENLLPTSSELSGCLGSTESTSKRPTQSAPRDLSGRRLSLRFLEHNHINLAHARLARTLTL